MSSYSEEVFMDEDGNEVAEYKGRMMRVCPVCLCAVSPKRGVMMTYEVDGKAYTDPYHKSCVVKVKRRLEEGGYDSVRELGSASPFKE